MEKSFDDTNDYVNLHLEWILSNTRYAQANDGVHCCYYDIMNSVYKDMDVKKMCTCNFVVTPHRQRNHTAFKLLITDMITSKRNQSVLKNMEKLAMEDHGSTNKYFVTIGFNHQTFNVKDFLKSINVLFRKSFVLSAEGVFEIYRTNGEHPHIHIIMEVPKIRAGIVVTKIFQTAGMSKIVLSRNFIDVKPCEEYHYKYINGEKIEEKMGCCEKDKLFREKNNIPHKLKK